MKQTAATQTHQKNSTAIPAVSGLLQRKCACGNHTIAGGECEECGKKTRSGLQSKLRVNEPGDIYEQEADRVTDQVMTTSEHSDASGSLPHIHHFSAESIGQMGVATPNSVDKALALSGDPLESSIRQDMEQRFGHDFARVRVHSAEAAEQSACDVNAHAYTVGHNVVFGAGRFVPGTHEGRRLIAHELTHVLQQSNEPAKVTQIQRKPAPEQAHPTLEESDKSWIKAFGLQKWLKSILSDWRDIQARYAAATAATFHPTEQLLMGILTASRSRLDLGEAEIKKELNGDPARLKEIRDAYRNMIMVVVPKFASLTGKSPGDVFQAHRREIPEWARPEEDISSVTAATTPVSGVRTEGIKFKRDDLRKVVEQNYWEAKVGKVFFMIEIGSTGARLRADTEERDAVFSVLWQIRPKTLTGAVTKVVTIPSRGKGVGGKPTAPLLYKFTFKPATKDTADMPSVEYECVAEGSAATVSVAPEPDKSYTPSNLFVSTFRGFPGNDMDKYWAGNPGEHRQLYNWIENVAPASFGQIVTTSTGKPTRTTTFKVKGAKSKSGISGLTIDNLGKVAPQTVSTPADYRAKTDAGDLALEEQQSRGKDKLGSVKVPRDISAAEAAEVKFLIAEYFKKGTRNVEVDVRVPSLDTTGEILYTFRFLPDNGVEAIRVGEPEKGTRLDPSRLDAGRSPEFLSLYKAKDAKGLTAFIAKRYPGLTISGKTVEELRVALNKEISTKAGDVTWFKKNYDLTILDSTTAEERLQKKHNYTARQTADLKNFERGELLILEATLETFSLAVLSRLKGVYLARQDISIEKVGKVLAPVRKRTGITLTKGADTTIIIFDQASINDETLFIGGRLGVLPTTSLTFAHEFGHAVGDQADIQQEFNKFVKAKKIKPVTEYAGSDVKKEFFPEAFALFNIDPEWMKANQPDLYKWFEELAKTGKAPKP